MDVEGTEVVILGVGEDTLVSDDPRGNDLNHAPFDELFGELRVFKLFADGDAFPRTDELREVDVEGVVGEAR